MVKLLNMNDDNDDPTEKPSSAQIVASIDDLMIEIIHSFNLKSLAQLRLVSKYWNTLISDPRLCSFRNRAAVGLIFEGGHGTRQTIFLNKSIISQPTLKMILKMASTNGPWYRDYKIVHSCNGLLLCLSNRAGLNYYVYNPTTRKYIALSAPDVVFYRRKVSICGLYLAFDPYKSPHYKVVCVLKSIVGCLYFFEVYSSETGLWRKVCKPFKSGSYFDFENGVYWNGAIHLINITTKPQECVYFSLDCSQTAKVFPNPPLKDDKCYSSLDYYFGESCDHLHFVDSHRELDEFNVYEMKRDYSEWFVKYKVCVPEMKMKRDIYKVLVVIRGKNDDDSFLVIATKIIATGILRIARYNTEQKTSETLRDVDSTFRDNLDLFYCSGHPFQYIESISSV